MPREASSSSAGQSSSSSLAGPGPSTVAARSASATASASSSTRSSPANDLFRITLPDSSDSGVPKDLSSNPVVAAVQLQLTEEGAKRYQDMLEQASSDLKARFASLDSSDQNKREKKRLFDEFMHNMHEIAEMQGREVEARAFQEAVMAKAMLFSKSENIVGPRGSSSSGFSSASSWGGGASATTSNFSAASSSSALQPSVAPASASGLGSGSVVRASTSGSGSRASENTKPSSTDNNNNDDGSSTEEETDRPQPIVKGTKANGKLNKSKYGKPPSLNTSSTLTGSNAKLSSSTTKKGPKEEDASSSPSTPTPTQARRARAGTISLPRSVSASSAFPDDTSSSMPLHNKSKSSENARTTSSSKANVSQTVESEKQKMKDTSKSGMSSPRGDARPELVAANGVSSTSRASTAFASQNTSSAGFAGATAKSVVMAVQSQVRGQCQKPVPQRPSTINPQAPVQLRENPSTDVNTNNAKKGNTHQMQMQSPSSSSMLKSPSAQSQTFQLAQAQMTPQSQSQLRPQAHAQMQNQTRKTAQDDSVVVYSTKDSGNTGQSANHKLWIPPKPPHMQNPSQSVSHMHTSLFSSNTAATTTTKNGKDAKEGNDTAEIKEIKEKKPRPVSFAGQGASISEGMTRSTTASTTEKTEKREPKGVKDHELKAVENGSTSVAPSTAPVTTAPTVPKSASRSISATAEPHVHSVKAEVQTPTSSVSALITSTTTNSAENAKGAQAPGPSAAAIGMNASTNGNSIASSQSAVSISTNPGTVTNAKASAASVSVPSTPLILSSGLSSASASEAATADIERERLRAERAFLSSVQSITAVTSAADGKAQLPTPINQPHAHLYHPAYTPTLQQQSQSYQKGVSVDATNSPYLHPHSLTHSTANANFSGVSNIMNPSTSGSTITSPFSPFSIASGFPSSSAATSAASSRAISRHASSSSADPSIQKDGQAYSHGHHGHGYHRENNKEKDKLAQQAAAIMIGVQPVTQANMFWQPGPAEREREREQRERERERNHGRTSSANNSSTSASAASSRSSSVSRHEAVVFGGFDPSTIRPTGRSGQGAQLSGNGVGNLGFDGPFASLIEGGPGGASNASGSGGKTAYDAAKIWIPGQGKDATPRAPRRGGRDRDAGSNATSPPAQPLALALPSVSSATSSSLVASTASTPSNASTSQAHFYEVSERAREERLRVRANEFHSRAEVVAVFQRRVEELMAEFAEALRRADDYEKFGPASALMKPGSP